MLGASAAIRGLKGLKRLVISNSPASMELWIESCNQWRKELPQDVESALQKHEEAKSYDDPECKFFPLPPLHYCMPDTPELDTLLCTDF